MPMREVRFLRGPNVWSRAPVVEAWVESTESVASACACAERILSWLPALNDHECDLDPPSRFADRLRRGTTSADILEHVAAALQNRAGGSLAGLPFLCIAARGKENPAVFAVREEVVGRACLDAAVRLCNAARGGQPCDIEAEIASLHTLAETACFGPNSTAILEDARDCDIPFRRLGTGSLVLLGHGARQHRIRTAETDRTGAIAKLVSWDKALSKTLLRAVGIPVAEGRPVDSPEDAWRAAGELGMPVVVKPLDADRGRGVTIGLTDRAAIEAAYHLARKEGTAVLVERFAPGSEHRLLVIGGQMIAASRGDAASVTGDGRQTIAELIDQQLNSDPRRGDDLFVPLNRISLDAITLLTLEQAGYRPESVPPAGETVVVRRNGNHAIDVTDLVHPEVAARAVEATEVIGLDIAGVDVVAEDIGQPLEGQGGIIVEVNEGPGMDMHLRPAVGLPRPVGRAILASLFPPGENGRIPILALSGGPERTAAAILAAQWLKTTGQTVGLACGTGLFVGDRCLRAGDQASIEGAYDLLLNPRVEIAVIEVSPRSLREEGLGFDYCDAAVVFGSETGATKPLNVRRSDNPVADLLLAHSSPAPVVFLSRKAPVVETPPLSDTADTGCSRLALEALRVALGSLSS